MTDVLRETFIISGFNNLCQVSEIGEKDMSHNDKQFKDGVIKISFVHSWFYTNQKVRPSFVSNFTEIYQLLMNFQKCKLL